MVIRSCCSSTRKAAGDVTAADLSHRYFWQPQAVDQLMADEQLLAASGGGYDQSQPGNVVWPLADQLGTIRDLTTNDAQTGVTRLPTIGFTIASAICSRRRMRQWIACLDLRGFLSTKAAERIEAPPVPTIRSPGGGSAKIWIGFNGGDANTNRYCGNSPTNATDPIGCEAPPVPDPFAGVDAGRPL